MSETNAVAHADETAVLGAALGSASSRVRDILERCLQGQRLDEPAAIMLMAAQGNDLGALCAAADTMRIEQAGTVVTYVVNRNINFTNVCVKSCGFCAFSRDLRSEQGYFLSIEEIVRRAVQARDLGATEVCLQAGLVPTAKRGRLYVELCRAIKKAAPQLHLHAFSPEEIKYGAQLDGVSIRDFLEELIDAGLGSLPGTSAEILDDTLRKKISPGRITTHQWVEVVTTAHALGLPTTSTMMFGHFETDADRVRHLALLRAIQDDTRGFTEFVPLAFIHDEAPLFLRNEGGDAPRVTTVEDTLRVHAVARLFLGDVFRNIQVSWVKHGLDLAQRVLRCGANDLGGTLMNESISTCAGAAHGQLMTPSTMRQVIRGAGAEPAERDTKYGIRRRFEARPSTDDELPADPLDTLTDPNAVFGTYDDLVRDERFRFHYPQRHVAKLSA